MRDTSHRNRALVPTGHEASSYTCLRSLHRRGVGTVIASEKAGVPAAASRFCDESVSLPSPREGLLDYRDALLELAARDDVVTAIPVRPEDCYVFSRFADAFSERLSLVVPTMEQLRTVHDRLLLAEAAEAAGVPVPETRPLADVDDWDEDLLIKSRYNVLADAYLDDLGPDDMDVVKSVQHVVHGRPPDPEAVRETMHHDPIVQEYVRSDDEFMFTALYDRGEPLATFQHRQIRGDSYTGGGGVYRRSVYDEELERVGRTLLDHLEWHGLACIEYMRDADTGEYVLTEINPRMWQSLPSTVQAGADFPYYYWLAATGRPDLIENSYRLGVGTHMLRGEVGYLASVLTESSPYVERPSALGTAADIVRSVLREPRFDYFALDDPGPFLAGMRNVFAGETKSLRQKYGRGFDARSAVPYR
ncbi:carboxylate--amine ligase [Halogeometricum luteum]|uniref:Carboxylate--amine ligase n=1 Tax=Halogeometricum luteum TaxID=2950537 RepID=A0ABU2G1X2_9EURY|nr:carboxylate--amine ligase [Halogeometricum sp. S3BR5-2]MDS0294173.1 carboxylate--amine ligase [Halogeometricum sp. S3BR5-2]